MIVLLGCGAAKARESRRAIDMYIGGLFRCSRMYCERIGGPHFILSARFGLLDPQRVIEPYDATLQRAATRRAWSALVLEALDVVTDEDRELVVLAGSAYVDGWARGLEAAGRIVLAPMRGLDLYQRLGWLRRQLERPPAELAGDVEDMLAVQRELAAARVR